MPRIAKDVIGELVTTKKGTTWKVVAEIERGLSRDRNNGIDDKKPIIRRFQVQCQKCNAIKESDYKNVFIAKNVQCEKCHPKQAKAEKEPKKEMVKQDPTLWEPKLKKDGSVDTRYTRGPKVEFVGKVFECVYDSFLVLEELPRIYSKNGRYVYRNFKVECQKCGTQRETLAASLNAKGVACNSCRTQTRGVKLDLSQPPIGIERKCEIISEINGIWDEMKRLQRMGQLTKFLVGKFNVSDWLLNDDEETEYTATVNTTNDIDDIDYGDDSIDWNDELNKYL